MAARVVTVVPTPFRRKGLSRELTRIQKEALINRWTFN